MQRPISGFLESSPIPGFPNSLILNSLLKDSPHAVSAQR